MSAVQLRQWHHHDNDALQQILTDQLKLDQAWPPPYAHTQNLAEWLAKPADLYRWVAVHDDCVVGHMGLGTPAPPQLEIFNRALGDPAVQFAELCRTCIAPEFRHLGIASLLTRAAIKHAIGLARIPVSTVLTNRTNWLNMMLHTGWKEAGRLPGSTPSDQLVCLLPPDKFITAVMAA